MRLFNHALILWYVIRHSQPDSKWFWNAKIEPKRAILDRLIKRGISPKKGWLTRTKFHDTWWNLKTRPAKYLGIQYISEENVPHGLRLPHQLHRLLPVALRLGGRSHPGEQDQDHQHHHHSHHHYTGCPQKKLLIKVWRQCWETGLLGQVIWDCLCQIGQIWALLGHFGSWIWCPNIALKILLFFGHPVDTSCQVSQSGTLIAHSSLLLPHLPSLAKV